MSRAEFNNFDHCLDLVREKQRNRYVALMFAPEAARAALSALYAFHGEIEAIRDVVKEPMAGELRLQWWRDAVGPDKPSIGSPVADALNATIQEFELSMSIFDGLLEARIFDMYSDAMPDMNASEGYAGETISVIYQMAAQIVMRSSNEPGFELSDTSTLSGHAGVAEFWLKSAAQMPLHRARNQVFAPTTMLLDADFSAESYLSDSSNNDALQTVRSAMIEQAEHHMQLARRAFKTLPMTARGAYLPMAPMPVKLKSLRSSDLTAPEVLGDISPLRRLWRTWRMSRGQF